MSSTDPENSTDDPEQNLTPAEIDDLNRLEALAQRRLGSYLLVSNALGEIRDRHLYRASHPSFEAYIQERWGVNGANDAPLSQSTNSKKPCEALARACEQTLSALDGDERLGIEIRLAIRKRPDPGAPADGQRVNPPEV